MHPRSRDRCRYCGAPLDPLTRRRGADHCDAPGCRHKAGTAQTSGIREALAAAARENVARQLAHLAQPPRAVVWLEPCESRIAETSADERAQHRAYLQVLVAERRTMDSRRVAASSADDHHPQEARLCAHCRGRCCQAGAAAHAFIDARLLERWRDEAPERSLHDAIDAYMAMLPPAHVEGACLYQTAAGCAMPRERRAGICNGFACDALEGVQKAAAADPATAVLAITFHHGRVERAAVVERDAAHPVMLEAPLPQNG